MKKVNKSILSVVLILVVVYFGSLYFMPTQQEVVVMLNNEFFLQLGKKPPDNLLQNHFVSSSNTTKNGNDEYVLSPRDTMLYKSLSIKTLDNCIQVVQFNYNSNSEKNISIKFRNIEETIDIKNITSDYYNRIEYGYLISLKKCNGNGTLTIINLEGINPSNKIFF